MWQGVLDFWLLRRDTPPGWTIFAKIPCKLLLTQAEWWYYRGILAVLAFP